MLKNFILIIACTTIFVLQTSAQNFDKVKVYLTLNKVEDAQKELDKLIAKYPDLTNKPEGKFYKLRLMYFIQKDDKLKSKFPIEPNVYKETLDQYLQLDDTLKLMKENFASEPLFDIYGKSYKSAIEEFNEKKWEQSIRSFKDAIKYSNIIYKNRFTTAAPNTFDTTSNLYIGFAYQNNKQNNEALETYLKFVNKKIVVDENSIEMYKFCLIQFIDNQDKPSFFKYLPICREVFPKGNWDEFESEFIRLNYSLTDIKNAYLQKLQFKNLTEKDFLEYAESFSNAKEKDSALSAEQLNEYINLAAEAYNNAFNLNPNNYLISFNLGVIYQNKMDKIQDKLTEGRRKLQEINQNKSTEKDPKKKAAANEEANKKIAEIKKANEAIGEELITQTKLSIGWFEKAFNSLKSIPSRNGKERNLINKTVDILSASYELLRDNARGKDLKAFDEYELKIKQYDELHGKF